MVDEEESLEVSKFGNHFNVTSFVLSLVQPTQGRSTEQKFDTSNDKTKISGYESYSPLEKILRESLIQTNQDGNDENSLIILNDQNLENEEVFLEGGNERNISSFESTPDPFHGYYDDYDPMLGIRIAITLSILISMFTFYLIYKSYCNMKRAKLLLRMDTLSRERRRRGKRYSSSSSAHQHTHGHSTKSTTSTNTKEINTNSVKEKSSKRIEFNPRDSVISNSKSCTHYRSRRRSSSLTPSIIATIQQHNSSPSKTSGFNGRTQSDSNPSERNGKQTESNSNPTASNGKKRQSESSEEMDDRGRSSKVKEHEEQRFVTKSAPPDMHHPSDVSSLTLIRDLPSTVRDTNGTNIRDTNEKNVRGSTTQSHEPPHEVNVVEIQPVNVSRLRRIELQSQESNKSLERVGQESNKSSERVGHEGNKPSERVGQEGKQAKGSWGQEETKEEDDLTASSSGTIETQL